MEDMSVICSMINDRKQKGRCVTLAVRMDFDGCCVSIYSVGKAG